MANKTVKYPQVTVDLIGGDGNAFAILGKVQKALRRAGVSAEEIKAFMDGATDGDYDHLLGVVMQTVEVA